MHVHVAPIASIRLFEPGAAYYPIVNLGIDIYTGRIKLIITLKYTM